LTRKIRVGVIPAAGQGKRLGYLSGLIPKCLFPLYDKPIIHYVMENMMRIGVEKIFIPIHYQRDRLIDYFDHARKTVDAEICLLELAQLPKGIALTIESSKKYFDEPFAVILGDDITITESLQPLVDTFLRSNAVAVEGVVREGNQDILKSTCCIELDRNKRISAIVEKPSNPTSNLRGCGVYIFSPEIFEYIGKTPKLPPRDEVEITNSIGLAAQDGRAYGEFINGININVNTPEDLLQAWLAVRPHSRKTNND
jgi:dTDP-glucose pyrophosphorylase